MSIQRQVVACVVLSSCICGSSALVIGQDNIAIPQSPAAALQEAQATVEARQQAGEQLLALLNDVSQPVTSRVEAARLLGKLQYVPAIDALIRHVDLADPKQNVSEERPDRMFPLATALAAYGNAPVPQIVDAFLAERNPQRHAGLSYAIRFGGTTDVAQRYLRGTDPPAEDDRLKRHLMKELDERLKSPAERKASAD